MNSSQRIFNKMSIFRRWKFQSRHKKLTEEWALAASTRDLSELNEQQHYLQHDNDNDDNDENMKTFTLKYLGKTSIDSERSKLATAEAIKSVISNSKTVRNSGGSNGNNNKKSQRIKLIVCPKGIEMRDLQTDDILLRVSIYKISYCSADAAHDHVFAFISSDNDTSTTTSLSNNDDANNGNSDEKLSCYVFLCPKRRIAHDVTLTVARCFENAYQNWRDSIEQKMFVESTNRNKKLLSSLGSSASSSFDNNDRKLPTIPSSQENEEHSAATSVNNLLIDLSQDNDESSSNDDNDEKTYNVDKVSDLCQRNRRNYLQNTWVSFDDDQNEVNSRQPLMFQENSSWDRQLVF